MANKPNLLETAHAEFDKAASFLGLDSALSEFLRWPMKEYSFTVPIRMDDGRSRTFHGYRILYNHARGPCTGGLLWHPDETMDSGRAMAACMTWRTSLLDLPLGGSAGGLICDSETLSETEKERLARGWMRTMAPHMGKDMDVLSPDAYTTPQIMAWMLDEVAVIAGRSHSSAITEEPLVPGGPRGSNDAAGRGGVYAVREACKNLGIDSRGTYAIQGFGNSGQSAALLHPRILGGGKLVAASDTSGAICSLAGIDPAALVQHKQKTGKVSGFPGTRPIANEDLLELDVDVLYPAALENVITQTNAEQIRARIICELADGAVTPEADLILHIKGVHVIPDFLANAGGVTVNYLEQAQDTYHYGWSPEEIHDQLDARVTKAYHEVLQMQKSKNVPVRFAAYLVAVNRVAVAVKMQGWI